MKNPDNSLKYRLRLIWAYRDILKNHCKPVFRRYMQHFLKDQEAAAHRLQGKECIEVAFFLTIPGMWKSDYLFRAMQQHPHFHPYVVIYPYSYYKGFDQKEVDATLVRTEKFIADKGFEYVIPYDRKRGKWQDVRKTLQPDVVVFATPYKDFPPQYFIYAFRHTLTCYVPYGFGSLNMLQVNYDLIFHNLVGMHFVETEIHRQTAVDNSRNRGVNVYISGYPGTEVFLRKDYQPKNLWKPQEKTKKRVIWAPHHTIMGNLTISTFLLYEQEMFSIAEKFQDEVQFMFKPHPLLKFKLQQLWGTEKTESYYSRWNTLPNAQLEESNYVDLFLTSDAMIHDCGSFTTEYLFTGKPVMYLVREGAAVEQQFGPFGLYSFRQHYHGQCVEDIERFLREVVIEGKDSMRESRQAFFEEYLAPKDGLMPSEKIIRLIEEKINS